MIHFMEKILDFCGIKYRLLLFEGVLKFFKLNIVPVHMIDIFEAEDFCFGVRSGLAAFDAGCRFRQNGQPFSRDFFPAKFTKDFFAHFQSLIVLQ